MQLSIVEKRHRKKVDPHIRSWILEFEKIDPHPGTVFRYADDEAKTLAYSEHWIDFIQFKFAMKRVFDTLDHSVLWLDTKGRPAKKAQPKARGS